MANYSCDDDPSTSTTATPVFRPTAIHFPPTLQRGPHAQMHRQDSYVTADNEEQDEHTFGIEKGFYKIQKSAQELLKFATTYQQHRETKSLSCGPSRLSPLPREIDLLSLTQLSWGVLHAVNEINNHSQRLEARDNSQWLSGAFKPIPPTPDTPAPAVKRQRHRRQPNQFNGCVQCGVGKSPRWRRGPAGRSTLCNVCGLLYAKRAQSVKLEDSGQGYLQGSCS